MMIFIAEAVWFCENVVDGRRRLAVTHGSLDEVVDILSRHPIYGGSLVATEVEGSAMGSPGARTWAVHERGTEPDHEGVLWITGEEVERIDRKALLRELTQEAIENDSYGERESHGDA